MTLPADWQVFRIHTFMIYGGVSVCVHHDDRYMYYIAYIANNFAHLIPQISAYVYF